jgi:pimeloyl-ACP methyl ester carboxylesterase
MACSVPVIPLLPIPLWLESRWPLEAAGLLADPVYHGQGVPPGGGRPVLLLTGFLAGDASLWMLGEWLRRSGYHVDGGRMGLNADCAGETVRRVTELARAQAARHGPLIVIGQSRGGLIGAALAAREPELVCGLITLGSPFLDNFAVHPAVRAGVQALAALGNGSTRGVMSTACVGGSCCGGVADEALKRFPRGVPFVSVFSRSDGVVDWHACLHPAAEHVEVCCSHLGMAADADAYRAVAHALSQLSPAPRRPLRAAA